MFEAQGPFAIPRPSIFNAIARQKWNCKGLEGVGALVAAIGLGQIIAGYLYPNTSEELTSAVEDFEKK